MTEPRDVFDDDVSDQEIADDFDALTKAFHHHVDHFAEEHDLSYGVMSLLSAQISVTMRMLEYMTSVEKPSAGGLKLDLDQYLGELETHVRAAKKHADEFVTVTKQALAEGDGGQTSE